MFSFSFSKDVHNLRYGHHYSKEVFEAVIELCLILFVFILIQMSMLSIKQMNFK